MTATSIPRDTTPDAGAPRDSVLLRQVTRDGVAAGAFGILSGFAFFVMWLGKIQHGEWGRLAGALVIVLLAQRYIEPVKHWLEHNQLPSHAGRTSLQKVVGMVLMMAFLELFILAAEGFAEFSHEHLQGFSRVILGEELARVANPASAIAGFVVFYLVTGLTVAGIAALCVLRVRARSWVESLRAAAWCGAASLLAVVIAVLLAITLARAQASYAWMARAPDAWSSQLRLDLLLFQQEQLRAGHSSILELVFRAAVWLLGKFAALWHAKILFVPGSWLVIGIAVAWLASGLIAALNDRDASLAFVPAGILLLLLAIPPVLPTLLAGNDGALSGMMGYGCLVWLVPAMTVGACVPLLGTLANKPWRWAFAAISGGVLLIVLAFWREKHASLLLLLGLFPLSAGFMEMLRRPAVARWPVLTFGVAAWVLVFTCCEHISLEHLLKNYRQNITVDSPTLLGRAMQLKQSGYLGPEVRAVLPPRDPWERQAAALQSEATATLAVEIDDWKAWQAKRLREVAQSIDAFLQSSAVEPAPPAAHAAIRETLRAQAGQLREHANHLNPPHGEQDETLILELFISGGFGFWTTIGILLAWARRRAAEQPAPASAH